MAKYRVLTFDGGGIRGILTAMLLHRLNTETAIAGWLDETDFLCGTSTGGLIALGLAFNLTTNQLVDLYVEKGKLIFSDSWLDNVVDLGKITGADYSNKYLEEELQELFGKTKLTDLSKRVLITAFDLDNEDKDLAKRIWKPKLFHNFPDTDSDGQTLAYKVGLYTTAAPSFFPSVDGFIDGGVYANNPAMCALAQTQDAKRNSEACRLEEVVLFSLGTGTPLVYITGQRLDWGYGQWAKPLMNLIMEGVAGIADFQCRQLLDNRYHRLSPFFPPKTSIRMDDVEQIDYLVKFAQEVDLTQSIKWIETEWLD
jgi:patatin-like phospholipase/acyl hydrolase